MGVAELRADLDQVVHLYESGMKGTDLAARYGVNHVTVYKALRKAGVKVRPRGSGVKLAPMLPPERESELVARYHDTRETLDTLGAEFGVSRSTVRRILERHGIRRRKGGQRRNPIPARDRVPGKPVRRSTDGYLLVWVPADDPVSAMCDKRGWVLEHRLVMAHHLGRPLLRTETVHHRNGIRDDNRLENLELRQGQHGNGQSFACADCGSRNLVAL